MTPRNLFALTVLLLGALAIQPAVGQKQSIGAGGRAASEQKSAFHPTKAVTIIVPYSAGGGTDAVGRLIAKALEEMWGQTVLVDNRTGGNGSIGAGFVARAAPDGHTLVLSVSGIAINAHVMKLPYDTATAFAPVTVVAYPVATLIGSPMLPANDLKELASLVMKEGPDKRTFASPDPGTRLIAERIFEKAGIKLINIPYKGASSFVSDIAAGRVDIGISSITSALPLIKSGALKSLGIIGDRRIGILPQVATFKEQGFSGLEENSWYGLFAPAATPASVVKAIQTDIARALATAEFQAKLADYGALPGGQSPAEFTERFQRDLKESGEVIQRIGMKLE